MEIDRQKQGGDPLINHYLNWHCLNWAGEAPAEPNATAGRSPPEASTKASGGRRAEARLTLSGSF